MKGTTKSSTATIYKGFLKYKGLQWEQPKYKIEETLPFIPQEKELDELISASSKTISTFLQILKETGARGIEAKKLKWQHIDTERKTVYITPAKGSNPEYYQ